MMVNSSDTSRRASTAVTNFLWTAKANLDEPVVQYLGQRILDEAATGDKEAALSELQHFIPALENEQLDSLIEELRSLWSSPAEDYTSRSGQPEQQISSSDPWSTSIVKASAAEHPDSCVSPQHIRRGDRRIVTVVATAGRKLEVGSPEASFPGETVPVTSGKGASDSRTSVPAPSFMAPLHDGSGGVELPLSRPGSSGTLGSPPLGGPNSFFGLRSSSPLCSSPSFSPVVGSPAAKSGGWGAVGTPVRGGGGYGGSSRSPSGSGSAFGSPRFHLQDRMTPAGPGPPCSSAAMAGSGRDDAHDGDNGSAGVFDEDSPRQDASFFASNGLAAATVLASQPARDAGEGSEPGSPNSFLPHLVSFNSGSSTGADSGLTGMLDRMLAASGSPPPEAGTPGIRVMGSTRPLSPSGLALEGPRPRHVRVMPNDMSRGGDMGGSGWNSIADEDASPLQRRSSAGSAVGEDLLPRGISCSDLKDQLPDELLPSLDDLLPSGDVFHFEDHHPQMQAQQQQQALQHHQKHQLAAQQQRQQLAAAAMAAFGASGAPSHLPPIQARRALAAASPGELQGGGSPLTPRLSSPSVLPRQNLGAVGMPPGVWGGGSPAHMSTPRGGGLGGGGGGGMMAGDFYNSPRAELTGSPRPPGTFSPGPMMRMGRFVPNMEGTLDSPRGTGFHRPAYGLDAQIRGSPREHPQRGQWVGELGPMDGPLPSNLGQGQGGSARAGWPSQGVSPDELLEITAVISRKFPNVPPERLASILLQNGGDIPRNLELLLHSEGVTSSPRYGPPSMGGSPHHRFGPPPMDYGPPPQQPWSPGGFAHGPQKGPPPLLRPESMSPINLRHRHSMSSGELEANRHKRDLGRGGVMGGGPGPLLDRPLPEFPGRRGPNHGGQQQPGSPWGHGPPPQLQHERGLMNEMGGHMGRGGPGRGGMGPMGGYGGPEGELMMENGAGALHELQANLGGGGGLWMDGVEGMGPFAGPPGHLGGHGGGQGPNFYDILEAEEQMRVMGALCEQVTAASLTGDDALRRELQAQYRMANRQRSGLGPGFPPHGLAGHPQNYGRGEGPGHGPPPPPWANLPTLDLAGRTVGDALPILKRELENMREAADATNQIREMVVHVGPNLNSKPTKQAQRLPGAVEKYLQEDHTAYLLLIPGLLKVVVRPPGPMPPAPDMWPGGPP